MISLFILLLIRLDFEPKTSSDFVDNLDLLDTIEDTIKDLKVSVLITIFATTKKTFWSQFHVK